MSRDRESTAINQVLRPAVFFDRDGVLNTDSDYLFEVDKFVWIDGQWKPSRRSTMPAISPVITNQSGVARGFYEEADVKNLHDWMAGQLATHNARIDAFEYFPFHPDGAVERYRRASTRRKPQPGMIIDLLNQFPVDTTRSFVVGDKPSDIDAACAAGLPGHVFRGGNLLDFILPLLTNG